MHEETLRNSLQNVTALGGEWPRPPPLLSCDQDGRPVRAPVQGLTPTAAGPADPEGPATASLSSQKGPRLCLQRSHCP